MFKVQNLDKIDYKMGGPMYIESQKRDRRL